MKEGDFGDGIPLAFDSVITFPFRFTLAREIEDADFAPTFW